MDNLLRPVVFILCLSFVLCCRRHCPEEASGSQRGKAIPGTSMMYAAREPVSSMFGEYAEVMNQLGFSPTLPIQQAFRQLDTNDDKSVTLGEWLAREGDIRAYASLLVRYDENDDGQISKKESLRVIKHYNRVNRK